MKKTIIISALTTIVTNLFISFVTSNPVLLFFTTWIILGIISDQSMVYFDKKSKYKFNQKYYDYGIGYCGFIRIMTYIVPVIMPIVIVLCELETFYKTFPNFWKIRNPFYTDKQ